MDRLEIKNLQVETLVGVHAFEREQKQLVIIDLELNIDAKIPARTDAIEDALNYELLVTRIKRYVETSTFFLIETLAESIVHLVKTEFHVNGVRLRLAKPRALAGMADVSIVVER